MAFKKQRKVILLLHFCPVTVASGLDEHSCTECTHSKV